MGTRKNPRQVEIRSKWYDVRDGWAGKLELYEYMKSPEYTANEPYMYINNLFLCMTLAVTKWANFI